MLDWLAERSGEQACNDAASLIEGAVRSGFEAGALRPMEFGGDMGTRAVTSEVLAQIRAVPSPSVSRLAGES